MTQLVWFRNDLRLADNPALTAACQSREPVRACFVVTPQQWQEHDWSAARVRFVLEHANALARELAELGVPLTFLNAERFSDGSDALLQFCTDSDIADLADPRSHPARLFSVAFDVCEVTTTTVEATTSAVELEAHFPKLGGLRAELRTTPLDTACVFDCACAGLCALT